MPLKIMDTNWHHLQIKSVQTERIPKRNWVRPFKSSYDRSAAIIHPSPSHHPHLRLAQIPGQPTKVSQKKEYQSI